MNSIFSEKHQAHLFLGKRDATPMRSNFISYSEIQPIFARAFEKAGVDSRYIFGDDSKGIAPHPSIFGHGGDLTDWMMFANGPCDSTTDLPVSWTAARAGAGCCGCAGPAHEEMEAAIDAGRPTPPFTDKSTIVYYQKITAKEGAQYDPITGENDNGVDPQDVLLDRQAGGFTDSVGNVYPIGPVYSLTPGNLQQLWELTWVGEKVGLGFQLQQAQEDQTNQGIPWNYIPGSPDIGGHYVPNFGRPKIGLNRACSWGAMYSFTDSMYEHCNDEAFAWADPTMFAQTTGVDHEHMTTADVEAYFAAIIPAKLRKIGAIA